MSRENLQGVARRAAQRQHAAKGNTDLERKFVTDAASQGITIVLALLSSMVYSLIVADGDPQARALGWMIAQSVVVAGAAKWLRQRAKALNDTPVVSPLVVAAGLLALAWEAMSRFWLESGLPFELLTMSIVRNLVLSLAIASAWPAYQRLCIVLSLFLTLFGMTASHDVFVHCLVGLFAIGAVCWMVVSHWENIRRRLHGREQSCWPRWILLAPLPLIPLFVALVSERDAQVVRALRGFLPSSGGIGGNDPYARGGVGDGEMLIAGTENIQSFAPIEDAPFMQDDQPSLYDLFDDTYEEEVRRPQTDRAIPLPPELASRARDHVHNRTEKAQREFSTLRKSPDPPTRRQMNDIHSNALFYVAGRVPLHLRLQVYDLFDGETWYPEKRSHAANSLVVRESNGKPWLQLEDLGEYHDYLGPAETHAIKVVNIDSSVIPAPLYLHGVHIDLVDRPDMFRRGPDGLVGLVTQKLPTLVPIHLATRSMDWDKLSTEPRSFLRIYSDHAVSVIPDSIESHELQQLATEWSRGTNPGWEQVRAVGEYLKTHFSLDPDWRPTNVDRAPIQEFLFESKRGPDYQFATAAALLLRSLGYSTRVASGFYAAAEKYDHSSRHTPVSKDDVHFWAEVRIGGGEWVTVEASPGYEVLGPPPGLWQQCREAIVRLATWFLKHWLLCAFLCLAGVAMVRNQHALADLVATTRWRIALWRAPERALSETMRLLEIRAALAGSRRPSAVTHRRWLGGHLARAGDPLVARQLYELRKNVDLTAYGPKSMSSLSHLVPVCRACAQNCTWHWFHSQRLPQPSPVGLTGPTSTEKNSHAEFAGR